MGTHRIVIEAVGSHGCGRNAKSGEVVQRCGHPNCVDCQAAAFVKQLQQRGDQISYAMLEHWPTSPTNAAPGPVDDLISGRRAGQFAEADRQPPPK